jgi:hypothetical protein
VAGRIIRMIFDNFTAEPLRFVQVTNILKECRQIVDYICAEGIYLERAPVI